MFVILYTSLLVSNKVLILALFIPLLICEASPLQKRHRKPTNYIEGIKPQWCAFDFLCKIFGQSYHRLLSIPKWFLCKKILHQVDIY